MLEACGYRVNQCLVWDKAHFGMGTYWRNQHENIVFASAGMPSPMLDRGMGSVLTCPAVSPTARLHPTEKPIALLSRIIEAIPGETVLDPFMGSGPTAVAAMDCGRRFVGCEINPHHFDTARRRVETAHKRPRMFVPRYEPATQEALL
jgi:site-specific DNA-methyltransferase (adenine-specific)